jgi:hypothetical protein
VASFRPKGGRSLAQNGAGVEDDSNAVLVMCPEIPFHLLRTGAFVLEPGRAAVR